MPSKNSSDRTGPNRQHDYDKIERNYRKLMEIAKLPDERSKVEALNKLLDEAEVKIHGSSDAPPPQSVTSSEEPRIDDLFTDVTKEREGRGYTCRADKETAYKRRKAT